MTLVERVRMLCERQKLSIYSVEKTCSFGNGTINKWDKNAPSIEKISVLANLLNVSIDYLFTGTDSAVAGYGGIELSDEETDFVLKFRQLNQRDRLDLKDCVNAKLARTFPKGQPAKSSTSQTGSDYIDDDRKAGTA